MNILYQKHQIMTNILNTTMLTIILFYDKINCLQILSKNKQIAL